jgi:hypothetical protein
MKVPVEIKYKVIKYVLLKISTELVVNVKIEKKVNTTINFKTLKFLTAMAYCLSAFSTVISVK